MYSPPPHAESLLLRQGAPETCYPGEDLGHLHPIRALGRCWVGKEVSTDMSDLEIADGLPRTQEGSLAEGLKQ
jgi:hypothetical protein